MSLLPAGSRASVVFEFDSEVPSASAIEATNDEWVDVFLGPVHGKVADQLLKAAQGSPLVSEIHVHGVTRGAEGTTINIRVMTKGPVSGSMRRSLRRLYVDLEPRGLSVAAAPPPSVPPGSTLARAAAAARRPTAPVASSPKAPAVVLTPAPAVAAARPGPAPPVAAVPATPAVGSAPTPAVTAAQPTPLPVLAATPSIPGVGVVITPPVTATRSTEAVASDLGGISTSWPPSPAPTRIRFLRSLSPGAVRGRPSLFSRFLNILTGGRVEPTMSQPYGIAVGPDRRVFVADTTGGVIHVYDVEKPGYSSMRTGAQSLIGITFIGNRMAVTDSVSGRVICLDQKGHELWTLGPKDGFERPTGIAAAADRLYVVDTVKHHVVIVSASGAVLGTFGQRGGEPGQFNFPTNIARSADGRLFVTDTMNFRVQVFDKTGRHLSTFGRLGDGAGDFDKPKGIALDSAGHVYVVEGLNDVVQIFDDRGRLLLSFGGSGVGDGEFWLPSGIAIANDVVYVADSSNRRVQMFEYLKGPQ